MKTTHEDRSGARLIRALTALAVTWGLVFLYFGWSNHVSDKFAGLKVIASAMTVSVAAAAAYSVAGFFGRWWPYALLVLALSLAHGLLAFIALAYAFGKWIM